jgi:hypothetical protein
MKKYCYFDGLLVIHPLISARYSSFTYSVKNSNTYSPPLKQTKHTQAVIPAVQTAPENKPNLSAQFYATEKSRRISGWKSENLAHLKIIKANAIRLWNNHRPGKNIIRMEEWKQST